MRLYKRLLSSQPRKSFVQPPFWELDDLRLPLLSTWGNRPDRERIENDFESLVNGAFKRNGPIFACILARMWVFAEARFQWRTFSNGRPGDLFGSKNLSILENPWPGGTTGELLARMELDASLAGNFFATAIDNAGNYGRAATGEGARVVRMRPDWVDIVIGSKSGDLMGLDAEVIGYLYEPRINGGQKSGNPTLLTADQVVHYSPIPDPEARFRGMSWLTPIITDIEADNAATTHKRKFFENGATPNMVVTFDKDTNKDDFEEFVEKFDEKHKGAWNAYKTLFLAGGADAKIVGADFKQLEFSATQGKGESRIASAAGVPPSWVGFSEGLQGSSLNAGNFNSARRRFADGTMRPLWRMASASLQTIVTPPNASSSLTYDPRGIAFLREDQTDVAEIQAKKAVAIRSLLDAGFEPDAAVAYVRDDDLTALIGAHSGLFSVQLQPPGTVAPANDSTETDETETSDED